MEVHKEIFREKLLDHSRFGKCGVTAHGGMIGSALIELPSTGQSYASGTKREETCSDSSQL